MLKQTLKIKNKEILKMSFDLSSFFIFPQDSFKPQTKSHQIIHTCLTFGCNEIT